MKTNENIVEIEGVKYVRIKILFLNHLSPSLSTYIDDLEIDIENVKLQLQHKNNCIEKLKLDINEAKNLIAFCNREQVQMKKEMLYIKSTLIANSADDKNNNAQQTLLKKIAHQQQALNGLEKVRDEIKVLKSLLSNLGINNKDIKLLTNTLDKSRYTDHSTELTHDENLNLFTKNAELVLKDEAIKSLKQKVQTLQTHIEKMQKKETHLLSIEVNYHQLLAAQKKAKSEKNKSKNPVQFKAPADFNIKTDTQSELEKLRIKMNLKIE